MIVILVILLSSPGHTSSWKSYITCSTIRVHVHTTSQPLATDFLHKTNQTFSKILIPPSSSVRIILAQLIIFALCSLFVVDPSRYLQQHTNSFKDRITILLSVLRFLRSSIQNQKALAVVRKLPVSTKWLLTCLCSCISENAVATDPKEKPKETKTTYRTEIMKLLEDYT